MTIIVETDLVRTYTQNVVHHKLGEHEHSICKDHSKIAHFKAIIEDESESNEAYKPCD